MKNLKLKKGLQINFVIILVIIVGILLAGMFINNTKVEAALTCPKCKGTNLSITSVSILADTHGYYCSDCKQVTTSATHSGASHGSGGKCTTCGYAYHKKSSTISKYTKTGTTHTPVYKCSFSQCSETYTGTEVEHSSETQSDASQHWKKCTVCKHEYDYVDHSGGKHSNDGKCTTCSYQYQTHGKERWGYYTNKTSAGHEIHYACTFKSSGCTYVYKSGSVIAHSGGTHEEGKCEDCGYKYQTHSQSDTIKNYTTTETGHIPVYECSYSGCSSTYDGIEENHKEATHENGGKCIVCDYQYQTHEQSDTIKNYITTDTEHIPVYTCTESGCDTTYDGTAEAHFGQTHNTDGKCTICDYQYVIHAQSNVIKEYKTSESGHVPVYTCTQSTTGEGCTSTYDGDEQPHTGGTHDNNGTCAVEGCGYKYQTHEQSNIIKEYKTAQTGHIPVYKCIEATCGTTYDGEEEIHTGGTHENDGLCTVNGCGYKYQEHDATTTVTEYTDLTETTHTPIYTCSNEECTSTVKGTAETHTGGNHDNDGTCTLCGQQYQTHEQTETISEYKTHDSIHIPLYECSDPECISLYIGFAEQHTGATHENDGKCTICDYQYQIHGISDEFSGYETTKTGHIKLYKCTFENCPGILKVEEESHSGGEHDNDGKCTICDYQYQVHGLSDEQVGYETTETGHTKLYECSYIGCEKTLKVGTEESHTGGEHENDGKCTICDYQYETHSASDEILDYEKTEDGHIPIYKCTFEDCAGTYLGTNQLHTGGTHENDGKCTVCTYQYQTHQKSDEIKEYTKTQENHIPLYKCLYIECTATYAGEGQNHTGATHENEGKCEICTYQYQTHTVSDVIIAYESNEEGHTPTYKCTYQDCTTIYKGMEESHIIEEWQDTENGLHSGECTLCNYKIIAEHNYNENGLCDECDARIPEDECNHTYEIQKNETHHWKMCPKCHLTEEGSLELHKYENYTENEDGTHSAVCTICEYELKENHNYEDDGICEECEKRIPSDECNHNYEMKHDDTYHWKYCAKCETIGEGTKQNHTYEKYVDNGDGTHSRICTICKYTKTETHTENCTDCKENESTPGTEDNATNGDKTVVDKEIPKAGLQNIIMMSILVVVAILVATMIKMKKYKDI